MTELSRLLGDLYGHDAPGEEEQVSYHPAAYPELDTGPLDGTATDQPTAVGLLTAPMLAAPMLALPAADDLRLGDEACPVPARLGASGREASIDEVDEAQHQETEHHDEETVEVPAVPELSAHAERWMPGDDDVLPAHPHRRRPRLIRRH